MSGCVGCCARAAARSPEFHESRTSGTQTRKYRALLEQFKLTHDQVRQAAASDALKARDTRPQPEAASLSTEGAT